MNRWCTQRITKFYCAGALATEYYRVPIKVEGIPVYRGRTPYFSGYKIDQK